MRPGLQRSCLVKKIDSIVLLAKSHATLSYLDLDFDTLLYLRTASLSPSTSSWEWKVLNVTGSFVVVHSTGHIARVPLVAMSLSLSLSQPQSQVQSQEFKRPSCSRRKDVLPAIRHRCRAMVLESRLALPSPRRSLYF